MLVLSRKLNESIIIDGDIRITVVSIRGNQVRLGFEAPERTKIFREELCAEPATDKDPERQTPSTSPNHEPHGNRRESIVVERHAPAVARLRRRP